MADERCPLCGMNRVGGWGIYKDVYQCGTQRFEDNKIAQSEPCIRVAAMKAIVDLDIKQLGIDVRLIQLVDSPDKEEVSRLSAESIAVEGEKWAAVAAYSKLTEPPKGQE